MQTPISNLTRFATASHVMLSPSGLLEVWVMVKSLWDVSVDGEAFVAAEQQPVRLSDVYSEGGDLLYPSDATGRKRGCDVVVVSSALVPVGNEGVVRVCVADREVSLRVRNLRTADDDEEEELHTEGAGGQQFAHVPLRYSLAQGGAAFEGRPTRPADAAGSIGWHGKPAADPHDTPPGVGAIPSHWPCRTAHYGSTDETWQQTRMPLVPIDLDARFYNVAHPALQLAQPPRPGEQVAVDGMTMSAHWSATVPDAPVLLTARYNDGFEQQVAAKLDTLLLEPAGGEGGGGRLELTLRAAFRLRGNGRTLSHVEVANG